MSLSGFRHLLIKKIGEDAELSSLLGQMGDTDLEGAIIESLSKMARNAGLKANHVMSLFGHHLASDNDGVSLESDMFRDALSHHLSHYKAALKAGDREMADQHLKKVMSMMHIANRAHNISNLNLRVGSGRASNGKSLPLISSSPWEKNYSGAEQRTDGKGGYKQLPKNWGRKLGGESSAFPDYRYMEMRPHQEDRDSHKIMGYGDHAYPFHEITVNDQHVNIDDVPHEKGKFESHPFDSHPISDEDHYKWSNQMGPEEGQKYMKAYHDWLHSPHVENWIEDQHAKFSANPEEYMDRGSMPSNPIHDQPADSAHIHPQYGLRNARSAKTAEDTPAVSEPPATQPNVTAAPAKPAGTTVGPEHFENLVRTLHSTGVQPEHISSMAGVPIEHVHSILGKK